MGLTKIGEYIEIVDKRNTKQEIKSVLGLNNKKEFMPTVATIDQTTDLSKYKIVEKGTFVFSGMQTGRDQNIRIGFSDYESPFIISPAYTTFKVSNILPIYFFMIFKSPEMDRYGAFLSDSSIRSNLDWDVFCNIKLEIPSLDTQRKTVDIYLAMVANQKAYEKSLENLENTYKAYIEEIRRKYKSEYVGKYLSERTEKNIYGKYKNLVGIGKDGFIKPNQIRTAESLKKCNVFYFNDFVYAPSSLVNGVISISNFDDPMICTEEYVVFYSNKPNKLLPQYLLLWAKRSEFGRRIAFNSLDSVRNRYYFQQFRDEICIPLPSIDIQKDIVEVFNTYRLRYKINEELKKKINEICPILIKGSILSKR